MAYTLKDRVLVTSTSTGTGDFSLGSAVTGYQAFTVVGNGAQIPYTIQGLNPDGSQTGDWEVGIGTWYSAGNYITRDTVLESSNSGSKVAFPSGDKNVFLDLPGELVVQGPDSATASDFVAFDGTSGKIIKDSGYSSASFATAAQGAKADTAVQPGSLATVAFTGAYSDLTGKPTLGTAAALDAGVANGVATLDGSGTVPISQLPSAVLGALSYQGTWNASTNTPTLTSSVGTKGYYYVVNVAGSTNLNGITDWVVGDWAVYNGTAWQKVDNTDAVTSVNGYTGTVVLTYTDVGAQPAGTYVTSVSGTAPVVSSGGTTPAISMHVADATNDGYLSSTDWSTFNGKVSMVYPGAGIPNSTGTAWGTSYSTTGTGTVVALGTNPTLYNPNIDVIDFDTTYATTLTAGQMGWDGNNTLGIGMAGGNVIQRIGEDAFIYVKASSAITKGQLCMFTGVVGASSLITAAPSTGVTNGQYIVGVAAESIATNGFGLIQVMGNLKGLDTSAFVDGDILYYNSAVTGGFTSTLPTSGPIVTVAAVTHAGNGGSGSLQIRISVTQRITAGTGISVSQTSSGTTVTNSAPDQVVSLTGAGTTTVTGTYPSFTITSNDQYTGTVTSVTGTSPISVATGTTTPVVSMTQANTSTNGWLSSTDWNTFNGKLSNPMTTLGDVIYGAASGTATRLAGNTTTAKQFLSQTGTGTASAAPAWSALPTVLPVLNRAGATVSVSVGNGVLPVLTHAGSTVNVAIN